jgi:hypothetical protein
MEFLIVGKPINSVAESGAQFWNPEEKGNSAVGSRHQWTVEDKST